MYRLRVLIKSSFRLALRKKLVLFSMIIFPVLSTFLILVNGMGGGDVSKTNVAVYNEANNIYSETILNSLKESKLFDVADVKRDESMPLDKQFEKIANTNTLNIFVYIPRDIKDRIISLNKEAVIIYDTGNDEKIGFLKANLEPVITRLKTFMKLSNNNETELIKLLKVANENSLKGNSENADNASGQNDRSNKFAGVIGFLSWFAIWGSSYVIVSILKEKDLKVFKRIMITNVSIPQYLSSKLIIGVIIGVIQVILMLISFKYIVKADYIIELWQLGLILFGFVLIAITINLAIVSFCSTEGQVSSISIIIVNVTAMLSGSYWPLEIMPDWMIKASYFMPQRWIMYTINQIANKNNYALMQYGLVVSGFIILFSSLSVIGFKYRSRFDI